MASDETTATVPDSPAAAAVVGDKDRVVMASRRADGTPDQTPDFEYIGDKDVTLRATEEQLKVQAVSAADVAARGFGPGPTADADKSKLPSTGPESDPSIAKLNDAHTAAVDRAVDAARAEVEARFTSDPALGAETATSKRAASRTTTSRTSTTTADTTAAKPDTKSDTKTDTGK